MGFTVGETVVYPHHGAALIEAIETRVIKGEEKAYLVLKVAQGDLTVKVPADNAEIVGVRDVVGQEGLDRVFEVLDLEQLRAGGYGGIVAVGQGSETPPRLVTSSAPWCHAARPPSARGRQARSNPRAEHGAAQRRCAA